MQDRHARLRGQQSIAHPFLKLQNASPQLAHLALVGLLGPAALLCLLQALHAVLGGQRAHRPRTASSRRCRRDAGDGPASPNACATRSGIVGGGRHRHMHTHEHLRAHTHTHAHAHSRAHTRNTHLLTRTHACTHADLLWYHGLVVRARAVTLGAEATSQAHNRQCRAKARLATACLPALLCTGVVAGGMQEQASAHTALSMSHGARKRGLLATSSYHAQAQGFQRRGGVSVLSL